MYVLSIALVVVGSLFYDISSRAVDPHLPVVAEARDNSRDSQSRLSLAASAFFERRVPWPVRQYATWAPFGLAVGVALIEAGFLLAYCAGWPLSSASLVASVVSAVLLAAVGIATLNEHLSSVNVAGAVPAALGLALLSSRA